MNITQELDRGNTTPTALLVSARAIIADKTRWTTRAFARNSLRNKVNPTSPTACKFCALGALLRVDNAKVCAELSNPGKIAFNMLTKAASSLAGESLFTGPSVDEVNDYHGHDAIMALYDRALITLPE